MISTTLKTILIDGDLDDSSLLLDVHQSYRDKDLLTNHFDDMEDDSRDQNSPFGLFPPTSDLLSNTLLANGLGHDSSSSSSNGSSATFSFNDSAYASSSSPPPPSSNNNKTRSAPYSKTTSSQSISIMRDLSSQGQLHHPSTTQANVIHHSSLSSSLSNIQSATIDRTGQNGTSSFFPKPSSQTSHQNNHLTKSHEEYQYNFWQCPVCQESYQRHRSQILPCFHSLCETCVDKLADKDEGSIICPSCGVTTLLTEVLPDCTLQNPDEQLSSHYMVSLGDDSSQCCTACKSTESMAVAKCFHCSSFLCHQCVCAHQIMNRFEGHHVVHMKELDSNGNDPRLINCGTHKNETLKYFCATCNIPICQTCTTTDHGRAGHEFLSLNDAGSHQVAKLQNMVENTRQRLNELKHSQKMTERAYTLLQNQYSKAQHDINETYTFYRQFIDDQKVELLKELNSAFNEKQTILTSQLQKIDEAVERANLPLEFSDRLFKNSSTTEILMFKKQLENKFNTLAQTMPEINTPTTTSDLDFVSNYQAIQTGVRNTFGYVRSSSDPLASSTSSSSAINHYKARPQKLTNDNFSKVIGPPSANGTSSSSINLTHNSLHHQSHNNMLALSPTKPIQQPLSSSSSTTTTTNNHLLNGMDILSCSLPASAMTKYPTLSSSTPLNFSLATNSIDINQYEYWSNPSALTGTSAPQQQQLSSSLTSSNGGGNLNGHDSIVDLVDGLSIDGYSTMPSHLLLPSRSNGSSLKRQKMIYHQKFGEFGVLQGQFTEPSGVAVNAQGDIIVADTNNHRIQIFDSNGRFRFQFGECGKRDGQLLYPNRVAVFRQTGDIIVTERSPTHQIQIYNQYGNFIRKFGANVLQHPRGVCVDSLGRIIVVECKVMRVFIFDINGNVLNKFTCSKYLEFPNGVCCNDKQEIFISDNRAHCIKVFSYEGQYLRSIGSEGVTNYPIGVVQNSQGDVLIADNHNNFNLTIFTQDGQLINALESKVKHAQCFDVALTDDGSVVLASKDYRIYVYRYQTSPSMIGSNGVGGPSTSPPSPLSTTSNTPNSSQMLAGECTSPLLLNGHDDHLLPMSSSLPNNGF